MKKSPVKNIFTIFLCFLIAMPMLFLSACQGNDDGDGGDGDDTDIGFNTWEYIDGFRAAIRPTNPGASAFVKSDNEVENSYLFGYLSEATLLWLSATYGSGGKTMDYDGKRILDNTPLNQIFDNDSERSFLNYDSIRYDANLTVLPNFGGKTAMIGVYDSGWDWVFDYNKFSDPQSYLTQTVITDENYYLNIEDNLQSSETIQEFSDGIESYYSTMAMANDEEDVNYQTKYYELYGKPFEINMLETILGLNLTTFTPTFYTAPDLDIEVSIQEGTVTWMKMQVYGQSQTEAIDPVEYNDSNNTSNAVSERLALLQTQYSATASYIGVQWDETESFNGSGTAQSDGGRLVQYILNKVIGTAHVSADDYAIANESGNDSIAKRYYRDTVTYIVKELLKSVEVTSEFVDNNEGFPKTYTIGDIAGSFFPVAGIEYLDYRLNDFIVPENGDDDFVNSPSQEYQSIAIIPKQRTIFQTASLHFQSLDHDLTVNVKMRWFNAGSTESVVQDVGRVEIVQGEYDWETNDASILIEPPTETHWIDVFNSNLEKMPATSEEFGTLDRATTSKYYTTINSDNGFGTVGVTNEKACNFSFFEFVFDVEKDPDDPITTKYDFQVKMFMFAVSA